MTKLAALLLQQEWETMINCNAVPLTRTWISINFLRPFLFFITHLSTRNQKIQARDLDCMRNCFRILLDSINSTGMPSFCLFSYWLILTLLRVFWVMVATSLADRKWWELNQVCII